MTPAQINAFCCHVLKDFLLIHFGTDHAETSVHYLLGRLTGYESAATLSNTSMNDKLVIGETFDFIMSVRYENMRVN